MIPQLIILVLVCVNFGLALAKHGESRITNQNAWHDLISAIIFIALLWWGGFFHPC